MSNVYPKGEPEADEAERAVVGSILIDPDAIFRAQQAGLTSKHFRTTYFGWVYEAAATCMLRGKPTDMTILGDELALQKEKAGSRLDILGGYGYLTSLINTTITSVYVVDYAELVIAAARKRDLLRANAKIAALVASHEGGVDDLMAKAAAIIMPIMANHSESSHLYGGDEAILQYLARQDRIAEQLKDDPNALIVTGYPDLDRLLGDIQPGFLHIVTARPGVGKTMYMEGVAECNAKRNKRVAFYHLELSHDFMQDRMFARYSTPIKTVNELRRGYRGDALDAAIDKIMPWYSNIVYIHCPGWSAERIASDIRRLNALGECDMAIVDYIQKISLPKSVAGENYAQLMGAVAEVLKNAAEDCAIPVVIGSQVARDYKKREDKKIHAEDMRDSGVYEEKANQVIVLNRSQERDTTNSLQTTERIEACIEKNNGGACGASNMVHIMGRYLLASEQVA